MEKKKQSSLAVRKEAEKRVMEAKDSKANSLTIQEIIASPKADIGKVAKTIGQMRKSEKTKEGNTVYMGILDMIEAVERAKQ